MSLFKKLSAFITCFVLVTTIGFSQKKARKLEYSGFFDSYYYRGPVSFTLGGGLAMYAGDYESVKGFYGGYGSNFNVGANYKVWPRIAFGAEFTYFTFSASGDSTSGAFSSSNMALDLYGRLYWLDDIVRKSPDRRKLRTVKSYFIAGAGLVKAPSGIIPAFPVGIGFSFAFSQRLSLLAEYTHRFTLSDNLDGYIVSGTKNDSYGLFSLKIQYTPTAPRGRKKTKQTPPDPNANREEHQEWRKKKEQPKPPAHEEIPLPDENAPNEENPEENPENEEKPQEENLETPSEDPVK